MVNVLATHMYSLLTVTTRQISSTAMLQIYYNIFVILCPNGSVILMLIIGNMIENENIVYEVVETFNFMYTNCYNIWKNLLSMSNISRIQIIINFIE